MHRIAEALHHAAMTEVDVGGLRWRLGVVSSADLIRQGVALLALLPSRVEGEDPAIAEEARRAMAGNVEAAVRMGSMQDAMVCAAVRECSADAGATWERIEFVIEAARESVPDGRVWVATLPMPVRQQLYQAAMTHNGDGGRVAASLATFRGGPDRAAARGPAGEEVR